MFDKDSLREIAETIVYVNLLLAILAIIALYDQWRIADESDLVEEEWQSGVENQLKLLTDKLACLEERVDLLCTILQKK